MLKGKTPLIVAITLAVIAGAVAYSAIRKQQADARRGWVLNEVLVATTDMSEGTVPSRAERGQLRGVVPD
jgi:pilus assembly protein CpaB